MAKKGGGGRMNLHVEVFGVRKAMRIPAALELAQHETLISTAHAVAHAIGVASRSSKIAANTRADVHGDTAEIIVGEGVPYAIIRDRGGSIRPRHKTILKFHDGGFRPRAYQPGIGYVAEGLESFNVAVQASYHKWFYKL